MGLSRHAFRLNRSGVDEFRIRICEVVSGAGKCPCCVAQHKASENLRIFIISTKALISPFIRGI